MKRRNLVFMVLFILISTNIFPKENEVTEYRKTIKLRELIYPPFFFEDGTGGGKVHITKLFEAIGYNVDIKVFPFARAVNFVNSGQGDCIFCFSGQTDEKLTVSSKPLYYASNVFIYKKSKFPNGLKVEKLAELKGLRAGNILGNARWTKIMKENGIVVEDVRKDELNFKKLDEGRIDILPVIYITANFFLEKMYPARQDEFGVSAPFELAPIVLNFYDTPENKEVMEKVNKFVETPEYYEILQESYGEYFPNGKIPEFIFTGKLKQIEDK